VEGSFESGGNVGECQADYDFWIRVEGAIIGDYHDINEDLCYDKWRKSDITWVVLRFSW
jgi:hypothetical protein